MCNRALPRFGAALHQRRHDGVLAQFLTSDLFRDFPDAPVHHPARRRRGAVPLRAPKDAQDMKRPPLSELVFNNVFFDTCGITIPASNCWRR